jgi:hypothetical protein
MNKSEFRQINLINKWEKSKQLIDETDFNDCIESLETISDVSATITNLFEMFSDLIDTKPIFINQGLLRDYFTDVYSNCELPCLVIKCDGIRKSYSRNKVIKALRGYTSHGNNKNANTDKALALLSDFVFHKCSNREVVYESYLTSEWHITPGLFLDTGNQNSRGPEKIAVPLGKSKGKKIGVIEGVFFNIFQEICYLFHFGAIPKGGDGGRNRVHKMSDLDTLKKQIGDVHGQRVFNTQEWSLKLPDFSELKPKQF